MTKMKKFMITLSALSVACLGVAIANVSPVKGSAQTTLEENKSGIFMNSGAAVRFDSEDTTGKKNGIRYELLLTETAYTKIKAGYEEATFGVLIAPAEYENTAELNYENVFGEEAVYDWAEWDSGLGQYVYNGTGDKTRIINVSTTVDFTAETVEDLKTTVIENVTYHHYYGSMTNVNENNIGREFVGVGYVQATYTAAAEEGAEEKTVTDTYFAEDNDNVRSMAYVAQLAIKDTSDKNKLDGDAKDWLQQNYVDKIADEETTYTLEYRIPTNVVAGDTAVIHKEEITANVDATVDVIVPALEGYECVTAADSVHVLANGKSKVVVNCTHATNAIIAAQGMDKAFSLQSSRFYYITEENVDTISAKIGSVTGLFYNTTDSAKTIDLTTVGSYTHGATGIFDQNGRLVKGIDSANAQYVTAENPVRYSSTDVAGEQAFMQNLEIPAHGYALIVQKTTASALDMYEKGSVVEETEAAQLVSYLLDNFITKYGMCSQLSLGNKLFTTYDGAEYYITAGYIGSANIKHASSDPTKTLSAGARVYATNGVFATSYEEVTANATFATAASSKSILTTVFNTSGSVAGRKTVELTATVNGVTTTFYRSLFKVEDKDVTISIGENVFTIAAASKTTEFIVDTQARADLGSDFYAPAFRFYTPNFASNTTLTKANNNGAAVILDENGKVVIAYGATGTAYYDADSDITATNITNSAGQEIYNKYLELLNTGKTYYLLLAPNDNTTAEGGNNCKDNENPTSTVNNITNCGSRQFLWQAMQLEESIVGQTVTISYYDL